MLPIVSFRKAEDECVRNNEYSYAEKVILFNFTKTFWNMISFSICTLTSCFLPFFFLARYTCMNDRKRKILILLNIKGTSVCLERDIGEPYSILGQNRKSYSGPVFSIDALRHGERRKLNTIISCLDRNLINPDNCCLKQVRGIGLRQWFVKRGNRAEIAVSGCSETVFNNSVSNHEGFFRKVVSYQFGQIAFSNPPSVKRVSLHISVDCISQDWRVFDVCKHLNLT